MTDGHVWTHGTWTVKVGREEEFVLAWTEMRDVVTQAFGHVARPTLLRDREHPNVFLSFGPWADIDHVRQFRGSQQFTQAIAAMGPLLDDFQTRTLDEVTR